MKTNVENKKEATEAATEQYIKATMVLSDSITEIDNPKMQRELINITNAVQDLIVAFTDHRNAMFEECGFKLVKNND